MSSSRIRLLISKGKIDLAIDSTLNYFHDSLEKEQRNEILHLSGRFQVLQKQNRAGTISNAEYFTQLNQITNSLLSFLDFLEGQNRIGSLHRKRKKWLIFSFLIGSILTLILSNYFLTKEGSGRSNPISKKLPPKTEYRAESTQDPNLGPFDRPTIAQQIEDSSPPTLTGFIKENDKTESIVSVRREKQGIEIVETSYIEKGNIIYDIILSNKSKRDFIINQIRLVYQCDVSFGCLSGGNPVNGIAIDAEYEIVFSLREKEESIYLTPPLLIPSEDIVRIKVNTIPFVGPGACGKTLPFSSHLEFHEGDRIVDHTLRRGFTLDEDGNISENKSIRLLHDYMEDKTRTENLVRLSRYGGLDDCYILNLLMDGGDITPENNSLFLEISRVSAETSFMMSLSKRYQNEDGYFRHYFCRGVFNYPNDISHLQYCYDSLAILAYEKALLGRPFSPEDSFSFNKALIIESYLSASIYLLEKGDGVQAEQLLNKAMSNYDIDSSQLEELNLWLGRVHSKYFNNCDSSVKYLKTYLSINESNGIDSLRLDTVVGRGLHSISNCPLLLDLFNEYNLPNKN